MSKLKTAEIILKKAEDIKIHLDKINDIINEVSDDFYEGGNPWQEVLLELHPETAPFIEDQYGGSFYSTRRTLLGAIISLIAEEVNGDSEAYEALTGTDEKPV